MMSDEAEIVPSGVRCGWIPFPTTDDRTLCGLPAHSAYLVQARDVTPDIAWHQRTPKSVVVCLCEHHASMHPGGLLEAYGYTTMKRARARELLEIERKYKHRD